MTNGKLKTALVVFIILFIGTSALTLYYQEEISDLEREKSELKNFNSSLEENYESLSQTLHTLSQTLEELEENHTKLKQEFQELEENYTILKEGSQYKVREMSLSELETFIDKDTTDENEWVEYEYNCYHFTSDLMANAIEENFAVGFVYLRWDKMSQGSSSGSGAHAITVFKTVDEGKIYVEPQNDKIIKNLEEGDDYLDKAGWADPEYEEYRIQDIETITFW